MSKKIDAEEYSTDYPDGYLDKSITCTSCEACCCRLEVILVTDTGVPEHLTDEDEWGGQTMRRLDDGWCVALDRTSMMCSIYEVRPLVCRIFTEGSPECITEREENL